MGAKSRKWQLAAAALVTAWVVAGCAPATDPPDPGTVPLPEAFPEQGVAVLPTKWWQHFDDPVLDRLQERALTGSFSLAAARARLRQARALARIRGAERLPRVDTSAEASASREGGVDSERYEAGLAAGFEVDLWGRLEAQAEGARLEAEATRFDLRAAAVSLTAEVAGSYFRLGRQDAVIELLERQRRLNEQLARVVAIRYRNGQARADEVLRQRRLAEQSAGELETARGERERLVAELAALLGEPPGELDIEPAGGAADLPPLPRTGVPADWLQRRPDLRAALLRVESADAEVAAAIADRYPSLDLSASFTTTAASPGSLFEGWLRQLAASLALPLFRGGALAGEVERSRAGRAVAFNEYAQTVMDALAEVERALAAERADRRLLERLRREQRLAADAQQRLRSRYINGAADYLEVLDALSTLQNVERRALEARWELPLDRVALIRALAGGAFGETGKEDDGR
ncbi:efflux transporter outer membrane subunit [Arhodomonas sp. SL1]|uniref:efflux transporter outer membrane subunit n=1 Tax=Arhodomonas sp. SL1 TaxID=3425691 RepID=UPI003F881222